MARIFRFPDECAARDQPDGVAGRFRPKYALRTMTTRVEEQRRFEDRFLVRDWLVEPRLNRISCDGDRVQLELRAMDVLLCLAHRAGEPVEKPEILDEI